MPGCETKQQKNLLARSAEEFTGTGKLVHHLKWSFLRSTGHSFLNLLQDLIGVFLVTLRLETSLANLAIWRILAFLP